MHNNLWRFKANFRHLLSFGTESCYKTATYRIVLYILLAQYQYNLFNCLDISIFGYLLLRKSSDQLQFWLFCDFELLSSYICYFFTKFFLFWNDYFQFEFFQFTTMDFCYKPFIFQHTVQYYRFFIHEWFGLMMNRSKNKIHTNKIKISGDIWLKFEKHYNFVRNFHLFLLWKFCGHKN